MLSCKLQLGFYLLLLPLMTLFVNLLIEVQGRYRIEFLPIIAILTSLGFYQLLKKITQPN